MQRHFAEQIFLLQASYETGDFFYLPSADLNRPIHYPVKIVVFALLLISLFHTEKIFKQVQTKVFTLEVVDKD